MGGVDDEDHPEEREEDASPEAGGKAGAGRRRERAITVLCATRRQKEMIQEAAQKAGLNMTKFLIQRALADDPQQNYWKQRAEVAEEKLKHYRADQLRAEAEAEDARRRLRDLQRQHANPQPSQRELSLPPAPASIDFQALGPRVLHLIQHSTRGGEPVPVLEREIVIELDLDTNGIGALRDFLARLVNWGIIERLQVNDRTAYRWKPPS